MRSIKSILLQGICAFNYPALAKLFRVFFHVLAFVEGVDGVDYFFDPSDRVWVAKSNDTYIAAGFQIARLWPKVMHQFVQSKLQESRNCWYLGSYVPDPGSVVLDVGAGDGTDTVVFAESVGDTGHVFAIEAHPDTVRLLRATCRCNKLKNVTIVEAALMGSETSIRMTNDRNHPENRVVRDKEYGAGAVTDIIETTTLDQLCEKHRIVQIDFLKMNIEGAEVEAIEGMTNSVAKVGHACIACHDFINPKSDGLIKAKIVGYMTGRGFVIRRREDDHRPWVRDYIYCLRKQDTVGAEEVSLLTNFSKS